MSSFHSIESFEYYVKRTIKIIINYILQKQLYFLFKNKPKPNKQERNIIIFLNLLKQMNVFA